MNAFKQLTHSMYKGLWLTALLFVVSLPLSAVAMDLQEAKSRLLVGESVSGYVGVVKDAPGVAALVRDINARRKSSFERIAQRNGTSLAAVEQLAGKKAIEKTPRGQMIQLSPGGVWIKK